jgi:uncharacterized protein (DUF4415 family)
MKPNLIRPTDLEDAAINAAALTDEDNQPLTSAELMQFKRMPKQPSPIKISTTVRFDQDVLEAFRATGKGWQTRMNAALKEWLREHVV